MSTTTTLETSKSMVKCLVLTAPQLLEVGYPLQEIVDAGFTVDPLHIVNTDRPVYEAMKAGFTKKSLIAASAVYVTRQDRIPIDEVLQYQNNMRLLVEKYSVIELRMEGKSMEQIYNALMLCDASPHVSLPRLFAGGFTGAQMREFILAIGYHNFYMFREYGVPLKELRKYDSHSICSAGYRPTIRQMIEAKWSLEYMQNFCIQCAKLGSETGWSPSPFIGEMVQAGVPLDRVVAHLGSPHSKPHSAYYANAIYEFVDAGVSLKDVISAGLRPPLLSLRKLSFTIRQLLEAGYGKE